MLPVDCQHIAVDGDDGREHHVQGKADRREENCDNAEHLVLHIEGERAEDCDEAVGDANEAIHVDEPVHDLLRLCGELVEDPHGGDVGAEREAEQDGAVHQEVLVGGHEDLRSASVQQETLVIGGKEENLSS